MKKANSTLKNLYNSSFKNHLSITNDYKEDILQSSLLQMLENKTKYSQLINNEADFKRYLYVCCRNTITRQYQNNIRTRTEALNNHNKVSIDSIEDGIIKQEEKARLLRLISQLSSAQKQVIRLSFFEGYASNEIADEMQISVNNIYQIRHTALQRLKVIYQIKP